MRIQYAITGYLPEVYGGAEVYTHHLARAMRAQGHDASVTTLDFHYRRGRAIEGRYDGVPVHRFAFDFPKVPAPLYALQFYPELYDEARLHFRATRPNVVHVTNHWFMSSVALAAMHENIPVVGTHVDFLWSCRNGRFLLPDASLCAMPPKAECRGCYPDVDDDDWEFVSEYRSKIIRTLATGYAMHHCPSPIMADYISFAGASGEKIQVWPYGMPESIAKADFTKKPSAKRRFAFVGRWNRIKGVEALFDAMKALADRDNLVWKIYGEPEIWNKNPRDAGLYVEAGKLPNVELAGSFEPSALLALYRDIDVLVLPSISPENAPVAILEALSLGTPVVCTDLPGMTCLVRDGQNGLTFPTGDAKALAERVARLADDDKLFESLADASVCPRGIDEDVAAFVKIYADATAPDETAWSQESQDLVSQLRKTHDRRRSIMKAAMEISA
ncbi:MAG: glycosyltransferase [Deltaproteobacteria bacterium]|nr:glycosyltransferase [Deltaproteobacteria bacterium]MCB9487505.1 glycosyltransferase [Deltaproteobacteria bacterium]